MSRSGYITDYDDYALLNCWRGAVNRAIKGRRGQAFLREMLAALDAMPEKRLISNELVCPDGVCAMGAVAVARGQDVSDVDPYDRATVAAEFGIAESMAAEIAYENDDFTRETPEEKWTRMRAWVAACIENEETLGTDS